MPFENEGRSFLCYQHIGDTDSGLTPCEDRLGCVSKVMEPGRTKDVGDATVPRGSGPTVFLEKAGRGSKGDGICTEMSWTRDLDVLLDVDGADRGCREKVVIGGIVGCRVV